MARVRSPSYPSYPLDEAIANARKVFEKDRRSPVAREVVAAHLGYKSLNGAADKSLATMMQYGMFEKVAKGEVRVSQWAIDIMLPDTPQQRLSALGNAAASPPLFRALNERFPDGPPSNETLRAYLLREEFNDRAIGPIINAYTKTCSYIAQEGASESSIPRADSGPDLGGHEEEAGDVRGSTFGSACVGDLIDWEVNGTLGNAAPMRVTGVSDDQAWVFVNESQSGLPMEQVIVKELASAPPAPIMQPPANPFISANQPDEAANTPQGHRSEKFDADEGVITISWPSNLSTQSVEDMQAWVELLMKRIERRAKAGEDAEKVN